MYLNLSEYLYKIITHSFVVLKNKVSQLIFNSRRQFYADFAGLAFKSSYMNFKTTDRCLCSVFLFFSQSFSYLQGMAKRVCS